MKTHEGLVRMVVCALFAAILCICSPISIEIGPVPITLAVFAVMLCGVTLELRYALISVLVYLVMGLFLPVFSRGQAGVTAIPGPTGGYIWSYLLMIPVIRLFCAIRVPSDWLVCLTAFCGCIVSLLICYLCGTLQFSAIAGRSFREALSVCVIPFLVPDLLKSVAASLLGITLRKTGLIPSARGK